MSVKQRLAKLERRAQASRGGGKLIVWWDCDGEPEPEHEANDTVLRVVYDDPLEVSDECKIET